MKITRFYWNATTGKPLFDPYFQLTAGEAGLLQFQAVIVDRPALDRYGKAAASQVKDLSDFATTGIFWYKTPANLLSGGDFERAFEGYYEDNWMDSGLEDGCGTIPYVIPITQANGIYRFGATLYDATGNFINTHVEAMKGYIVGTYLGDESNVPETVTTPNSGIAEITGTNTDSSWIAAAGMTTTGIVSVWPEESTAGPPLAWPIYDTDRFKIRVAVAPELVPGDGLTYRVGWQILKFVRP